MFLNAALMLKKMGEVRTFFRDLGSARVDTLSGHFPRLVTSNPSIKQQQKHGIPRHVLFAREHQALIRIQLITYHLTAVKCSFWPVATNSVVDGCPSQEYIYDYFHSRLPELEPYIFVFWLRRFREEPSLPSHYVCWVLFCVKLKDRPEHRDVKNSRKLFPHVSSEGPDFVVTLRLHSNPDRLICYIIF